MLLNVGWYYSRYSRFISPSPAVKQLSEDSSAKNKSRFPERVQFMLWWRVLFICFAIFGGCLWLFHIHFTIFLQFLHASAFHLHPPPMSESPRLPPFTRGGPPGQAAASSKSKSVESSESAAPSNLDGLNASEGAVPIGGGMSNGGMAIFPSKWRANERFEGSFQVGKRNETESKTSVFCFLFKILWKACQKHMQKHKHYHRRFQGLAAHQKVDPLGIPSCFQIFCLVSFSPNRINGSGIFSIIFLHLHSFDGCWLFKFQVYNYWRGELLEIGAVSVRFQRNILKFQGACSSKTLIPPCWFWNKPKHVSEACFQTKPNYHILWTCWANGSMIILYPPQSKCLFSANLD